MAELAQHRAVDATVAIGADDESGVSPISVVRKRRELQRVAVGLVEVVEDEHERGAAARREELRHPVEEWKRVTSPATPALSPPSARHEPRDRRRAGLEVFARRRGADRRDVARRISVHGQYAGAPCVSSQWPRARTRRCQRASDENSSARLRLADAVVAGEQDDPTLVGARAAELGREEALLRLASDEDAAGRSGCAAHPASSTAARTVSARRGERYAVRASSDDVVRAGLDGAHRETRSSRRRRARRPGSRSGATGAAAGFRARP